MRVLLDTSAYSALMRGDDGVAQQVRNAEEVLLSAIVVGELLFGFRGGSRLAENVAILEAFLKKPFVTFVPVTRTTADRFSRIAMQLKQKGTPIPTNDIWIAAHALETGADLLSLDDHFRHVDGLVWIGPSAT
jgi:tRNA(fMet)-specific endonuclease VapC